LPETDDHEPRHRQERTQAKARLPVIDCGEHAFLTSDSNRKGKAIMDLDESPVMQNHSLPLAARPSIDEPER
jgi:hypothetical protein